VWPVGLVLAGAVGSCLLAPQVRDDIAVIEGGDAVIYKIDRTPVQQPGSGTWEVRPGGHTVDVTATTSTPIPFGAIVHKSGLVSLCVKARPGHRYRIKARVRDGRMQLFFVDASTGEPPKTPCGPDEDDD